MQVVAEPLPPQNLLDAKAWVAVRERQEKVPAGADEGEDDNGGDPRANQALASEALASRDVAPDWSGLLAILNGLVRLSLGRVGAEDELDNCSRHKGRGQMCWEVVVKEQLTAHDEEREVVSSPGEEEEARGVVQTRTRSC